MAIYVYETIPQHAGETPRRFEVTQSMKDAPLQRDPTTGTPVRRVISGGYGLMGVGTKPEPASAGGCAPGCACHSGGSGQFVPPCESGGTCPCD